jgi:hypothetical protein
MNSDSRSIIGSNKSLIESTDCVVMCLLVCWWESHLRRKVSQQKVLRLECEWTNCFTSLRFVSFHFVVGPSRSSTEFNYLINSSGSYLSQFDPRLLQWMCEEKNESSNTHCLHHLHYSHSNALIQFTNNKFTFFEQERKRFGINLFVVFTLDEARTHAQNGLFLFLTQNKFVWG